MKDFILLFRQPNKDLPSAEDFELINKKWIDWVGGIAAQGRLASQGAHLAPEGKVLKSGGVITDGPFVEIREHLGGFIVIRADTMEEATTLAHGCPSLDVGGSVEIRPIYA